MADLHQSCQQGVATSEALPPWLLLHDVLLARQIRHLGNHRIRQDRRREACTPKTRSVRRNNFVQYEGLAKQGRGPNNLIRLGGMTELHEPQVTPTPPPPAK